MKRSSLTPVALGLGWLVSLGFVFALGIISAFAFHLKPGTESTAGLSVPEREAGALFEDLVGEPLDWPRLRSYNPADRVPPQVRAIYARLSALPRGAERQVLSERFFRILPPAKLEGLLEGELPQGAPTPAQRDVLGGLFRAWQTNDPMGAEAFRHALTAGGGPDLQAWTPAQ